jgi:hypothetical protein
LFLWVAGVELGSAAPLEVAVRVVVLLDQLEETLHLEQLDRVLAVALDIVFSMPGLAAAAEVPQALELMAIRAVQPLPQMDLVELAALAELAQLQELLLLVVAAAVALAAIQAEVALLPLAVAEGAMVVKMVALELQTLAAAAADLVLQEISQTVVSVDLVVQELLL